MLKALVTEEAVVGRGTCLTIPAGTLFDNEKLQQSSILRPFGAHASTGSRPLPTWD